MWIASDGARMCGYLVIVSSHGAFHVTGMGVISATMAHKLGSDDRHPLVKITKQLSH